MTFSIFGRFCRYNLVMGPAGPQNRPKSPTEAKERVLVITLARGGVTGRSTPPLACTMGCFDRFRRVRDPNGTTLTSFGPPAGPARPARAVPEIFFGRGSPGSRKKIFPHEFFLFKNDIHWVLSGFRAKKKLILDPSRPP